LALNSFVSKQAVRYLLYAVLSHRAASASVRPPRRKQPWRLDVVDAQGPIDVDAFLRRLVDVLLEVQREANPIPKEE